MSWNNSQIHRLTGNFNNQLIVKVIFQAEKSFQHLMLSASQLRFCFLFCTIGETKEKEHEDVSKKLSQYSDVLKKKKLIIN